MLGASIRRSAKGSGSSRSSVSQALAMEDFSGILTPMDEFQVWMDIADDTSKFGVLLSWLFPLFPSLSLFSLSLPSLPFVSLALCGLVEGFADQVGVIIQLHPRRDRPRLSICLHL